MQQRRINPRRPDSKKWIKIDRGRDKKGDEA
jgi:hypothetical protein